MSSLWLSKKKKSELVDFADQLGLQVDGYLKTEIENLLTDYLDTHSDECSGDPTFSPYYDTVATRSPVKTSHAIPLSVSDALATRSSRRRTNQYLGGNGNMDNASTYATETLFRVLSSIIDRSIGSVCSADDDTPEPRNLRSGSRALSTRTPRTLRSHRVADQPLQPGSGAVRSIRDAARVPLPPSPAAVADAIESGANAIRRSARKAVEKVAIQEKATGLRDRLSNVVSVNAASLTYEVAILLYHIVPLTYSAKIPTIPILGNAPKTFFLPDLFVLLTAGFWGPFATWLATAILIPLANAYFFNLTATAAAATHLKLSGPSEEYKTDPLAFAVTKALVAYLVYYKEFKFLGILNPENLAVVDTSVGRDAQLIGAGISGLAALWASILRR